MPFYGNIQLTIKNVTNLQRIKIKIYTIEQNCQSPTYELSSNFVYRNVISCGKIYCSHPSHKLLHDVTATLTIQGNRVKSTNNALRYRNVYFLWEDKIYQLKDSGSIYFGPKRFHSCHFTFTTQHAHNYQAQNRQCLVPIWKTTIR